MAFLFRGQVDDDAGFAAHDLRQLAVPFFDLGVVQYVLVQGFGNGAVGVRFRLGLDADGLRLGLGVGDGGLLFGLRLQKLLLGYLLLLNGVDKGLGEVEVDDVHVGDIEADIVQLLIQSRYQPVGDEMRLFRARRSADLTLRSFFSNAFTAAKMPYITCSTTRPSTPSPRI